MNRKRTIDIALIGRHYGKIDLERVGFFDAPSPSPFDVFREPVIFREGIEKGRQILGGPSSRLFEKKFGRIFEGEALRQPRRDEAKQVFICNIQDVLDIKSMHDHDEEKKNSYLSKKKLQDKRKIGGRMLPTSPSKKHSTPGDWYGCFTKPSYFSPGLKIETRKKMPVLPNMKIKPNPLGGPGYTDICLNPYPSYSHEPYDRTMGKGVVDKMISEGKFLTTSAPLDYFPPNPYKGEKPGPIYIRPIEKKILKTESQFYVPFPKKPGGNHDGCFSKFPKYTSEPYVKTKDKVVAESKFISTGPFLRSKYTNSIISQITRISCNARNYAEYRERVYPL